MKILIFDTETNDKVKDFKKQAHEDLDNYPFIMQLSASLIHVEIDEEKYFRKEHCVNYGIINIFNSLVKPTRYGKLIELSQGAFDVHGITIQDCIDRGNTIEDCIIFLQGMITQADVIICHNVNFDKNVVQSEALRLGLELKVRPKTIVWCSMLNTVDTCKIPNPNRWGGVFKWPKLEELYQHTFGKSMHDKHQAHDAMGDVNATEECILELLNRDINLFNRNVTT